MTHLYFVRHAQPDYRTGENNTFPLSEEGMQDRLQAAKILDTITFDVAISSPYRRSIDTIQPIVDRQHLTLYTDIRLRERDNCGGDSNNYTMFQKRWNDFSFHEEGGESLDSTMSRNIAALKDILIRYPDKTVLIGTHGTALSTIIHYYDPSFGYEQFIRIIDYMPYILRMDFDNTSLVHQEELFYIHKLYHGVKA